MRDKTRDLTVRWYCRNCWEHGVAFATIRMYNDKFKAPDKEELLKMASLCHVQTKCTQPDIRLHYDTKNLAAN